MEKTISSGSYTHLNSNQCDALHMSESFWVWSQKEWETNFRGRMTAYWTQNKNSVPFELTLIKTPIELMANIKSFWLFAFFCSISVTVKTNNNLCKAVLESCWSFFTLSKTSLCVFIPTFQATPNFPCFFSAGYGLLVIICWLPTNAFISHLTTQDSDRTPAVSQSS